MSESKQYDADQVKMMEEEVILIDMDDKQLGRASKHESHQMENIEKGMLHRAFSVFLFNSKGELMLQQRSNAKITFPLRWTNTCCSHPLYFDEEREEAEALGVKRAAIRKLEHELGIKKGVISLDEIHFLTRIYYVAGSDHSQWGEHEIDYILFIKKDLEVEINYNEVAAIDYVNADKLKQLFSERRTKGLLISPWFHMIANKFLYSWWEKLDEVIANKGIGEEEAKTIHRLKLSEEDM